MKNFLARRRERERQAYEAVAREIARGSRVEGLWLKAMSDAGFDQDAAKSGYVRLRVAQILDTRPVPAPTPKRPPRPQPAPRAAHPKPARPLSLADFAPRPRRAWGRGLLWLLGGVAGFQLLGWLVLGQPFAVDPVRFAERIFQSFAGLGQGAIATAAAAAQLALLVFAIYMALRAFAPQPPRG